MTLAILLAPGLRGALPFLLAGTVLLVAALLLWIASVVRRAHEAAEFEGGAATGDAAAAAVPEVDLDALHLKLRRSFRDGLAQLRKIRGRDARYDVPWVLVAGEPGSGKTAAMLGCGLERPYDEAAPGNEPASARDPLRWEFYDRGVALDLKGDLFLRADGSTYEEGWNHFLHLLAEHRGQRPLDGLVLTLPAPVLRGPAAREQAAARGEVVSRRLREMQKTLGIRIPVYLLVTRCDVLPGFASMAAQLPAEAREEAFGWSSPQHVDAAFRPEWVDAALEEMHADLLGTQAELLSEATDPDGVFQLPGEVKGLAPGIRAFLEEVFRESVYHESFSFRGLYFSGSADPADALTAAAAGDSPQGDATLPTADDQDADGVSDSAGVAAEPELARPVFLRDFLGEKVFAERNLARRAAGGRFGRDRRVVAAQAAMVLLTVVGGLGLWLDNGRLVRRDAQTATLLNGVAARVRPLRLRDGQTDILPLMDELARIDPRPLKSWFAPTSWVDPVRRRVTRAASGAFSDVILPAMRDSLEQRAERLAPTGHVRLIDLQSGDVSGGVPVTGATVQRYLADLGELSANVRRFNTLARQDSGSVGMLDSVAAYVFGERQARGDSDPRGVIAGALRRSGTRPITGASHTDVALARADSLVSAAYDGLLDQVRGLRDDVNAAEGAGPAQLPLDQYRRMAGRVDSVRGYVTSDWLNPAGGLPPELARLLRAIPNSEVISGQTLARAFPSSFAGIRSARLQSARQTLGDVYSAAAGTPDSAAAFGDDGGSGAALALRTALDALKGRSFMGTGGPVSLLAPQPAATWAVWNVRALDDALGMFAEYQAYSRDRLNGVNPGARNLVQGLATVALEARMTQAVARARAWVPAARPFGLPARERDLRTRADALRPAATRILRLMAAFDSLHLTRPYTELASILVDQDAELLADAEKLLADSGPYAPLDPDFSWWNGQKPLAPQTFGAADAEELEGYLSLQRTRVAAVAQGIAAPLLADFESPAFDAYDRDTGVRGQNGPAAAVRWRGVVQALDGYAAKTPGNSLVALEQFIRTGMDGVDLGGCDASLGRRRAVLDLFGQLRERLRDPLAARCRTVAATRVAGAYNRLRAQFQTELAGRFPFAAPGAGNGDADVDAVRRFYRALDQQAWADSLVRSGTAGVGGPGSDAAAFLEEIDAARPFLATLLGADTTGQPAFVVMAEFRAARARERGGEQIAEWWLEVGGDRLTARDSVGAATPWRAGDAVRLGVRWAMDSPLRPVPTGLAAPGRVADRQVSWSFGGDWALLRLISTLGATGAELGSTPARQRHMLALSIPTVPVVVDSTLSPERARVFVRVRLRDPVTGAERALPAFPPYAPALRGGRGEGTGDRGQGGIRGGDQMVASANGRTKWTDGGMDRSRSPDDAVAGQRTAPSAAMRWWTRLLGWWKEAGR
ncbi:type VI secretion protein IcmF/TssM N-terminal domain-containing protein [Longimicrobium sp.]|uniref:type VI secretion protein IcmF/TssM N-terminal domain-containing protein n=1 Tax=Longimicrobium sp. TaxID=2029185 RepID=UPI002CA5DB93|nr:type VI secretion protein IcmF/TssM N-terminal domain-containing protein [Longimicrobium sp.]HSU13837.1 type VI secretion protein IcmF/TssM N-terminal domain-containing protein [Longimicrobium sp.]